MTILVTGGAGFIGSNLIEEIVNEQKVICLDNFNSYYDPKIKRNNIKNLLNHKSFSLIEADIRNKKILDQIFEKHKIEKIVHLAAMAGVRNSVQYPFLYNEVNIGGTLNLLELAKEYDVKNFVFASSSSVYGQTTKMPFSEEHQVFPISPYGATKRSGELFCDVYNKTFDLPTSCLRFFTVYGERGRPEMAIYKFARLIEEGKELPVYEFGKSKRDYTHVSDIVDGIKNCLIKKFECEIFNLGNSDPVELNYLISLIEQNLDKRAKKNLLPAQAGDPSITFADISKAKSMINFNPKTKIEKGVKKFIDWFFEQKEKNIIQ